MRTRSDQAGSTHGPEAALIAPITVGSASTTAGVGNLSSAAEMLVRLSITGGDIHIRFGQSDIGASTTSDVVYYQNTSEDVRVDHAHTHFRAIRAGSTNATVRIGIVSR